MSQGIGDGDSLVYNYSSYKPVNKSTSIKNKKYFKCEIKYTHTWMLKSVLSRNSFDLHLFIQIGMY